MAELPKLILQNRISWIWVTELVFYPIPLLTKPAVMSKVAVRSAHLLGTLRCVELLRNRENPEPLLSEFDLMKMKRARLPSPFSCQLANSKVSFAVVGADEPFAVCCDCHSANSRRPSSLSKKDWTDGNRHRANASICVDLISGVLRFVIALTPYKNILRTIVKPTTVRWNYSIIFFATCQDFALTKFSIGGIIKIRKVVSRWRL